MLRQSAGLLQTSVYKGGETRSDIAEPEMIAINELLKSGGIDLERTKLVRHRDNDVYGLSVHDLWMADPSRFETYQRIQRKGRFGQCDWIVAFVAAPQDQTLFVGVYRVKGMVIAPTGTLDPSNGRDVSGFSYYDLTRDNVLRTYAGRILVDWGLGYRAWVQRADGKEKAILEIRREKEARLFPGFAAFSWPIRELALVPQAWRRTLSEFSGVYLLICKATGKQYVGSVTGSEGFWSRWENYRRSGHGGNEGMKATLNDNLQVSILEVVPSSTGHDDVLRLEARWKEKLLSRRFGLNRN